MKNAFTARVHLKIPTAATLLGVPLDDLDKYLTVLFENLEGYVYSPVRTANGEWRQQFYHWPEEQENLVNWIKTSGMEHDVYVCPSIFGEKSARKQSVRGSQVVWVEFDGQEQINLDNLPSPNLVVQTSTETHNHIYWRVPFSSVEVIESINRRLTYGLEADSSGWDINQVLRPPLTVNYKHDLPVTLLPKPHRNVIETGAFDKFTEPPQLVSFEDIASIPDPIEVLTKNPLSKKIWLMIKNPTQEKGLRSTFLMHLGYALAEEELSHSEIVSLLLVADEKVGKFVGRTDRLLRLAEIASIAIGKQAGNKQQPVYSFGELLNFDLSIEHIWGDILTRRGSVLLAGEPGIGKTQFAFNAATSICLGQNWLAREVPKPKRVAFFSLEMNEVGCKYILAEQAKNFTNEQLARLNDTFFIVPRGYHMSLDEIEYVTKKVEPEGIFVDTVSEVCNDKLTDETEANRILRWDAMMRNELDVFTWWNHHTRKANADNKAPVKISDIYGSFLYAAKMESIMILHGNRDNDGPINWFRPKVRYGQSDRDGTEVLRTKDLTFVLNTPPKEIDVSKDDSGPTASTGFHFPL